MKIKDLFVQQFLDDWFYEMPKQVRHDSLPDPPR